MLIFTWWSCSDWVNSPLVNWLPCSVLNTSGLPQRILQSIDAEFSLQGVGQSPGHQVPAV